LPYNGTLAGCLLVAALGAASTLPLVRTYVANHFTLPEIGSDTHWAVMGLWLVMASFQTFVFSLMIRALGVALPQRSTQDGRNEAASFSGTKAHRPQRK